MPGLIGAAGEAAATASWKDAPAGKPVRLSPAAYRLPTSQRPTAQPAWVRRILGNPPAKAISSSETQHPRGPRMDERGALRRPTVTVASELRFS